MENQIDVDLRLVKDQKSCKAVGSIIIPTAYGDLTILKVKVIQQDGKEPWMALPTNDYKDKETGDFKHSNVIELSARLKKAVSECVLAKYRELLESGVPF